MKRVVLIGSGNVAEALAPALADTPYALVQVFGRNPGRTQAIARLAGCPWTTDPDELAPADIYLMSVSDRAIGELSTRLDFPAQAVVAHTAGSVPLEELAPRIGHRGVLYPLQTFSSGRAADFRTIPLFVCGDTPQTEQTLAALARSLSGEVRNCTPEQLRQMHLAAVFACNFSNHMYAVAQRLLGRQGIPGEVLRPLIAETTAKALENPRAADVQTGPARRGDQATQQRHLRMLDGEPTLQQIYQNISTDIWETSKKT